MLPVFEKTYFPHILHLRKTLPNKALPQNIASLFRQIIFYFLRNHIGKPPPLHFCFPTLARSFQVRTAERVALPDAQPQRIVRMARRLRHAVARNRASCNWCSAFQVRRAYGARTAGLGSVIG